jgi:hypothetical protein
MTIGMVQLLSLLYDGKLLRTRWTTFWLGDIFLSLAAMYANIVIDGNTTQGFQGAIWAQLLFLAAGVSYFVGIELSHVLNRKEPKYKKVAVRPGQLWHTTFAGFVAYQLIWAFITMIRDGEPTLALYIGLALYGGYALTAIYDFLFNPKRKEPVTLTNR